MRAPAPVDVDDGGSIWELAFEQINHRDKLDAVLEILAGAIAERMVMDAGGRENAARQVESVIAAALDRAEGAGHHDDSPTTLLANSLIANPLVAAGKIVSKIAAAILDYAPAVTLA